jgi:hypothetical protein
MLQYRFIRHLCHPQLGVLSPGNGGLAVNIGRFAFSGRSSAWLERLVRVQEVAGSNPVAPTFPKAFRNKRLRKAFFMPRFRLFLVVCKPTARELSFAGVAAMQVNACKDW